MNRRRRMANTRRRVDALMIDECAITRPADDPGTFDPATGGYSGDDPATIYTGRCLVQNRTGAGEDVDIGDQIATTDTYSIFVPAEVTGIDIDDRIAVTDSDDPDLATGHFRVIAVKVATMLPARHLICERNLG